MVLASGGWFFVAGLFEAQRDTNEQRKAQMTINKDMCLDSGRYLLATAAQGCRQSHPLRRLHSWVLGCRVEAVEGQDHTCSV